ncbi:hypothetical protein FQA39_LY08826 [Lamprigera yunnana]|nr:hypothetical protein FQA39_LY08826 [Lamprigera yunnana]
MKKILNFYQIAFYSQKTALPLRSTKQKSNKTVVQSFADLKRVRVVAGKGGDGCISFLHLWSNEFAGPDGGDGGNGGHIIFKASENVKDLSSVTTILQAESGIKGQNKDCHGKNAEHKTVDVPIGTVIKNSDGNVVGDLEKEGLMFIAARGGAGGKGNHFFTTDTEQSPKICEYGAYGEDLEYTLEIRTMAHVGMIGFPNAGKSTLLRAISRARPKVAPYAFTTLKPYLGMVLYDDYEQVAVADLPGLIPDSHKNKGLGIQFLRHVERCIGLLYVIDVSLDEPWKYLHILQNELTHFNDNLLKRPQLVVANKIDLSGSYENLQILKKKTDLRIVPVSAKLGKNLKNLLDEIKIIYDQSKK